MTGPPPDDLKDWSKANLVRECRRLRAIMREHAEQVNPSHSGGGTVDVAGDPHAQGGVIIDARGAVLLDACEVVLVDRKTEADDDPVVMVLRLGGRINYGHERADTAYMVGGDGCAGIVTQIVGLVQRAAAGGTRDGLEFAADFKVAMEARMDALPKEEPDGPA